MLHFCMLTHPRANNDFHFRATNLRLSDISGTFCGIYIHREEHLHQDGGHNDEGASGHRGELTV